MSTSADFYSRFPEFCDVPEDRVDMFLSDAALLMLDPSDGRWLDFYDIAQLYFAAHMLQLGQDSESGDAGTSGPVKKQEVDDVMIEFAVSNLDPKENSLYSTSYGKQYIYYRRICFNGIYGV
jgi:hypothetical protein